MYCRQCGTLVQMDAKFCSKCGSPVTTEESKTAITVPSVKVDVVKPRKFWLYIVGVLLFLFYAGLLIPAFVGQSPKPVSGFGSMFWTGLFFRLLWKYRGRKGWHGALVGVALGVLIFFIVSVISGYNHGR